MGDGWGGLCILRTMSEVQNGHPVGAADPVLVEVLEIEDEAGLRAALEGAALVIDAVVGTGFKPPLRGLAAVAQRIVGGERGAGGGGRSAEWVGCGFDGGEG